MKKKIIAIMLVGIISVTALLSACGKNVEKTKTDAKPKSETTENVVKENTSKEVVDEKDTDAKSESVRPQDNFYEYVKSEKLKNKVQDEDSQGWDHFADMESKIEEDLMKISDDLKNKREEYKECTVERAIAELYKGALDSQTREKVGLVTLATYIDELKGANSVDAYLSAIARIQKELGSKSLISLNPEPNVKDTNVHALVMEDPHLIAKKEHMQDDETIDKMKEYIEKLLSINGMDSNKAKEWSSKIVDLKKELAENSLSKNELYDTEKVINYLTSAQIAEKMPNLNVNSYLENSGRAGYENIIVTNPKMLPLLNKYITEENLELLKNYSLAILLNDYAPYLNNEYVSANAEYDQLQTEGEDLAWDAVKKAAEKEIGDLYAKRSFSPEKKAAVEKIVKDIVEAYKKRIENLTWMSAEGKKGAIKKLETMQLKIAYPDKYKTWVNEGVIKTSGEGSSFIDNIVAINKWSAKLETEKVNTPVDRSEWGISPQTINGYYDHLTNDIVIPAAMLQAPFYDENQSYAKNLGGIGAVIGHEITHAFDDNGSKYDEKGNLRQWWSDSDHSEFNKLSKKFIEYYGNFEAIPGHKVDGELTLGENIADLGGISVVSSILADDVNGLKEMFTNYAYSFASIVSDDEIKDQIQHDEHSPNNVRINAALSSTEGFYKAFDVKEGDKMYVAPEKRVALY